MVETGLHKVSPLNNFTNRVSVSVDIFYLSIFFLSIFLCLYFFFVHIILSIFCLFYIKIFVHIMSRNIPCPYFVLSILCHTSVFFGIFHELRILDVLLLRKLVFGFLVFNFSTFWTFSVQFWLSKCLNSIATGFYLDPSKN